LCCRAAIRTPMTPLRPRRLRKLQVPAPRPRGATQWNRSKDS
jgi:hypothetical protein